MAWCTKCHYGSKYCEFSRTFCPQCGKGQLTLTKNPFPDKPTGMGSGRPRGGKPCSVKSSAES